MLRRVESLLVAAAALPVVSVERIAASWVAGAAHSLAAGVDILLSALWCIWVAGELEGQHGVLEFRRKDC